MLLWVFQMSIYMIDMSNFSNNLMTLGLEAKTMLLKIWLSLIIFSTTSAIMEVLVSSLRYGIPMIFKKDFYWGSLGTSTWFTLILFIFLTYFSIVWRLRGPVTLLVVITIPLLSAWIKSAIISNLILFKALLMLEICSDFTQSFPLSKSELLYNVSLLKHSLGDPFNYFFCYFIYLRLVITL